MNTTHDEQHRASLNSNKMVLALSLIFSLVFTVEQHLCFAARKVGTEEHSALPMVASPRHADAGRSVIAAPEQHRHGPAAADPRRRDEVSAGSRRSEEDARKRAAPASGVAAEQEERRRRLWRSGEAAALYMVAALRRSASDKGEGGAGKALHGCTCRKEGCFGGNSNRQACPRARRCQVGGVLEGAPLDAS